MVADVLAPIWHQVIWTHHNDVDQSTSVRDAQV